MSKIIGHRGARNLWPENSLTGFRKLLDLPVDGVELDVHLSAAGELLVIHDPTLDRTTDRTGPVKALPLGERHRVVLKDSTEGIPVLDEVLAIYAPTKLEVHVEIKADVDGSYNPEVVRKAAAVIERHGLLASTFMTSFSLDVIAMIKEQAPGVRTLLSFWEKSAERYGHREGIEAAARAVDVVAVEKSYLDANWDMVTGIVPLARICGWVPNTEAELAYWMPKGLGRITSDRPDLAVAARSAHAPHG